MDLMQQLESLIVEDDGVMVKSKDRGAYAHFDAHQYQQSQSSSDQLSRYLQGGNSTFSNNYDGSLTNPEDYSNGDASSSNVLYHGQQNILSLVPTAELPDNSRSIFNFSHFNKMQSTCFKYIYKTDNNSVISAPTGSGKTVLFELAILRLLSASGGKNNIKVLYIAPSKSLCNERKLDWSSKFASLGLNVGALTSDTSFLETEKVKKANIIITTPEKWDLMTRKWSDYTKLFDLIKLLLIDEVHFLRENRGSALEVTVTRMQKICDNLRIIALSATVPNIEDVSAWIKYNSENNSNAQTFVFGEEYRPVKLKKIVCGYNKTSNDFVFDSFLNSKLIEVLNEHSLDKPVLIFCPTRNSTVSTAKYISKNYFGLTRNNSEVLPVKEKDLLDVCSKGVCYHHAGLSFNDRISVEKNFINGSVKILCSTSTLAVGVNLPAYLVVIKGTKIWSGTVFEEYSELDILQMMGRAGRPQFETQGKAVLMTESDKINTYERLVQGNERLESRLHLNLHENLTAEIYLKTVTSIESAMDWFKLTFFYTRYRRNPTAYSEIPFLPNHDMDQRLANYCEHRIKELLNFSIIKLESGGYACTAFGDSMTRYYILFDTMKMFIKSKRGKSVEELLILISQASEFASIRLKRNEKKLFKEINSSPFLRYPLKNESKKNTIISQNYEKIYLMIQYELGGLDYPNSTDFIKIQQAFKQDKFYVFKHIGRILRCFVDCCIAEKDSISLLSCLRISICIAGKCWDDLPIQLRQLEGVGLASVRKFANQDIRSFEDLRKLEPNTIEFYLGFRPGQGNKILNDLNGIPNFDLSVKLLGYKNVKSRSLIEVKIEVKTICETNAKRWHGKPLNMNVVSCLSDGELIDFRRSNLNKLNGLELFTLDFALKSKDAAVFVVHLFCEEISGLSRKVELNFETLIPSYVFKNLASIKDKNLVSNIGIEEEDDGLDDLLIKASSKQDHPIKSKRKIDNEESSAMQSQAVKRPRENGTCKHSCKDKTKCRHFCCREGLAPKVTKRTSKPPTNDNNVSNSSSSLEAKTRLQASLDSSLSSIRCKGSQKKSKPDFFPPDLSMKKIEITSPTSESSNDSIDVIGMLRKVHQRQDTIDEIRDKFDYDDSISEIEHREEPIELTPSDMNEQLLISEEVLQNHKLSSDLGSVTNSVISIGDDSDSFKNLFGSDVEII